MPLSVDYMKIARRVVFLLIFLFFLSRVVESCLKWYKGDVGTFQKKGETDSVGFPSISLCFKPKKNFQVNVFKNETWTYPNSSLDRVIEIRQRLLSGDR